VSDYGETLMGIEKIALLIICCLLLIYLGYALLWPERF